MIREKLHLFRRAIGENKVFDPFHFLFGIVNGGNDRDPHPYGHAPLKQMPKVVEDLPIWDTRIFLVLFTIREYSDVISTTMAIDRDAFVSVTKSHEINGEGWTFNKRKARQSKGDARLEAMKNANTDNNIEQ